MIGHWLHQQDLKRAYEKSYWENFEIARDRERRRIKAIIQEAIDTSQPDETEDELIARIESAIKSGKEPAAHQKNCQ